MTTPASAKPTSAARPMRKVMTGVVVSDRMQKTLVVKVTRLVRHPRYPKILQRSSAFKVHDETNTAKIGDWVKIMETRPLSKDKRWCLLEVLRRGRGLSAGPKKSATVEEAGP